MYMPTEDPAPKGEAPRNGLRGVGKSDAQLAADERERRRLIAEADAQEGTAANLFDADPGAPGSSYEERERRVKALLGEHDPDEKHAAYYHGLQKLLMDYLPKDTKVRRMIYDEKNIFINRGRAIGPDGRRGSDGRMASIELMEEAIEIVAAWLRGGATALELYMAFYEANERRGYPHQVDVDAGQASS